LGTVAHRLLEEAGRGAFSDMPLEAIEKRWVELLAEAEDLASRSWLDRHLLPLSSSTPDFEVRRLRAISAARTLAGETANGGKRRTKEHPLVGFEVEVSTPDGRAGGRIDAVSMIDEGPVLKDYKSGVVYGDGSRRRALKPEYAAQLKLYAAIYAAMTGTWPSRLEVVPIAGKPVNVPFTNDECDELLREAISLRGRINDVISSEADLRSRIQDLATPRPDACGYCAFRPQCAPYFTARQREPEARWPIDVRGRLVEQRLLGNGRLLISLDEGGTVKHIRGIDPSPERHPALARPASNELIAAYNLRSAGSTTSFKEGPFTIFYAITEDQEAEGLGTQI
jgi:hypothetical protein